MAKRSKRPTNTRTPNEAARRQTGARNAAASRSSTNIAYRSEPFGDEQSRVSRDRRTAPRPPQRRRYGAVPSSQDLFGTWEPPPPQRARAKASGPVSTCEARHTRREVIFATRATGAGAHAPKLKFTNRKC